MIREIGIDLRLDHRIEAGDLPGLLAEFDAVFLGVWSELGGLVRDREADLPGV